MHGMDDEVMMRLLHVIPGSCVVRTAALEHVLTGTRAKQSLRVVYATCDIVITGQFLAQNFVHSLHASQGLERIEAARSAARRF